MNQPRIGIITSSTRPTRIGPRIVEWAAAGAPVEVDVDILDLAEIALPFFADSDMPRKGNYDTAETRAWSAQVRRCDAFIIAVAEYNGGYTAPLKNALDSLYQEWNGKPVALIGYGAHGGMRAMTALEVPLKGLKLNKVAELSLTFGKEINNDGSFNEAPDQELTQLYHALVTALNG